MYDAAIVGAGPAGSATALLLARAGHRVALIDRASFPRAKPCGDCISPGANDMLRRWGLWPDVLALEPALLRGWSIRCGSTGFSSPFPESRGGQVTSLALPRHAFDQALWNAAVRAGAQPIRATVDGVLLERDAVRGVRFRDDHDALRARLVVGADGLRSRIARSAGATCPPGPLRKLSLTAHVTGVRGDGRPSLGELHLGDGFCIGLAPVGNGTDPAFNLTVVADARRHARAIALDPAGWIEATLDAVPDLRDRLHHARPALDPAASHDRCGSARADSRGKEGGRFGTLLASGPFDRPTRFRIADGLALVGDAAGYYDPFTGQGIHEALAGAEDLATVADTALRRTQAPTARALQPYDRRLRVRQRSVRRLQRGIEWVVSRPGLFRAVAPRLEHAPDFAQGLIAATADLASPASVLAPRRVARLLLAGHP